MVSSAYNQLNSKYLMKFKERFVKAAIIILSRLASSEYVRLRLDKHAKSKECKIRFEGNVTRFKVSNGALNELSDDELIILCVLSRVPKLRIKYALPYMLISVLGIASAVIASVFSGANTIVRTLGTLLGMLVFISSILSQVISESITKRELRKYLSYDKLLRNIDGTYAEVRDITYEVIGKIINYLKEGRTSLLIKEVISERELDRITYLKSLIR